MSYFFSDEGRGWSCVSDSLAFREISKGFHVHLSFSYFFPMKAEGRVRPGLIGDFHDLRGKKMIKVLEGVEGGASINHAVEARWDGVELMGAT